MYTHVFKLISSSRNPVEYEIPVMAKLSSVCDHITKKKKNQCTLSEQGITLETDVQVRKEASLISRTAYVYSVNCT